MLGCIEFRLNEVIVRILGTIMKTIRRVVKKVVSSQVAISYLESSGFLVSG